MIPRDLAGSLVEAARRYPVVTVTGPRQSGKTTLCRATFPEQAYVSLEPLDARDYARNDPRGFLAEYGAGAIIDEVHHAPDLLSYLQAEVDRRADPGRFILTGSQQLGLTQAVSQSLAGRTAVLFLLPPSWTELGRFAHPPATLFEALWSGAYPRIYDRGIPPDRWLADYVATYVQRDVRQITNVTDLESFTRFLRLCAGRTSHEVNLSAFGSDAGVSHNTARSWLSVLEAGFICFRLPSWHRNVRKQMIKAAKLHFFDSGLVCHLLGIGTPDQLRHHPLRGAIFESWVAAEVYKARAHRGREPRLFHYRDAKRLEVDLIVDGGAHTILVEAKSSATVVPEFFRPLRRLSETLRQHPETRHVDARLVFGGEQGERRHDVRIVPWRDVAREDWNG